MRQMALCCVGGRVEVWLAHIAGDSFLTPPDSPHCTLCARSRLPRSKRRALEAQVWSETLTVLSNLADLANAVHWLPPGILWAGRFPPWLVGLLGTISSLLSIYQATRAREQVDTASP